MLDLSRFDRGQRIEAGLVEPNRVMLDVSVHNAAEQRVDSAHLVVGEERTRIYPCGSASPTHRSST